VGAVVASASMSTPASLDVIAVFGVVFAFFIPDLLMSRSSPGLAVPAILVCASMLVPASRYAFLPKG